MKVNQARHLSVARLAVHLMTHDFSASVKKHDISYCWASERIWNLHMILVWCNFYPETGRENISVGLPYHHLAQAIRVLNGILSFWRVPSSRQG